MDPQIQALIEEQRAIIRAVELVQYGYAPPTHLLKYPVVQQAWDALFVEFDACAAPDGLDQFQAER